ncbi:hypothetical protein ACIOTI_17190 [Streptomyces sp. NPDC087843]|uniref:hypothetical protein n=1 Tax=Streptomyces sp. NPDC087843 TaxID=3365804 RepID=UPI0037F63C88
MIIAALAAVFAGSVAAHASSGWFTTDANGSTSDTPAEAIFRGSQVTAIRGASDNALWFNVNNGGYTRIGGTTFSAPALSEFNGDLYLFQTGQDGNLYYQTIANPGSPHASWHWTSTRAIPGPTSAVRTTLRPAVASSGDQLHIIAVGNNERIYHSALSTSGRVAPWTEVPGGARTESGPAASTSPDGYLMVVHRGTNNLMYSQRGVVATGVWDGSWSQLPHGTTSSAPALSFNGHDGRMVEAWRDANTGIIQTSESSTRGVDQTNAINAANNVTSPSGPGLAYEDDGVGLAIRGSNFTDVQGNLNMYYGHIYINNNYYG